MIEFILDFGVLAWGILSGILALLLFLFAVLYVFGFFYGSFYELWVWLSQRGKR